MGCPSPGLQLTCSMCDLTAFVIDCGSSCIGGCNQACMVTCGPNTCYTECGPSCGRLCSASALFWK